MRFTPLMARGTEAGELGKKVEKARKKEMSSTASTKGEELGISRVRRRPVMVTALHATMEEKTASYEKRRRRRMRSCSRLSLSSTTTPRKGDPFLQTTTATRKGGPLLWFRTWRSAASDGGGRLPRIRPDRQREKSGVGGDGRWMMALPGALRNVCLNLDWTYSVFWSIRPRP